MGSGNGRSSGMSSGSGLPDELPSPPLVLPVCHVIMF